MADNTVPVIGPLTVWVLPANGTSGAPLTADAASFPWSWGWIKEPRLSATGNRLTRRPGAMGSGALTILRQARQEPNSKGAQQFQGSIVTGQYVCITADKASLSPYTTDPNTGVTTSTVLKPANILWWGWISALNYTALQGTSDGIGTATVLEVGHLLDQQTCTGWARYANDHGYPDALASPPTANIGDSASYVIGNARRTPNAIGSTDGYLFAKLPEECGTAAGKIWTRWRLLQHIVAQCRPGGMPPLAVVCADGSQVPASNPPVIDDPAPGADTIASFLNDTSVPEVYDLRNLTVKGALDLCIPQARGFNWTIELADQKTWQVVVYSYGLGGPGAVPINTFNGQVSYSAIGGISVNDPLVQSLQVVNDCSSMPDEVWVEGSPIVWGNTVSFSDGNLKEGWERGAGKQEDIYRRGAQAASDYNTLSPDLQLERNAMVRSGAGVRDVYTRYGLYSYMNGDVRVAAVPGIGMGASLPLCPQLDWTAKTQTLSINTLSRCPYLPTAELLRTIPWPEGVQGDGTDIRPDLSKNFPQFLRPRLFRYDAADQAGRIWVDLESRSGHVGQVTMHLDVDDRGAALRVTLASPEFLALNHWVDVAGGTTTPARSDISGEGANLASPLAIDYTKLVATIGIESDQTVRVVIQRPGITSNDQVRRRLVIREPALQCWVMRSQAIIGLLKDGTPERVTNAAFPFAPISGAANGDAGILIRNDWPAAQKRALMAAAWVFRKRTAVRIQRASPDLPPTYARIGFLITQVNEPQTVQGQQAPFVTVNTVVEEVVFDFTAQPRVEVATTMPQMIGFPPVSAGGGGAPSGGGSVSTSLGGTVSQAVLTQQQVTGDLNREAQRVPVIIPRISPLPLPVYQVAIIGGNVLSSGQQGVKSASVTSVPSHYNPATDTSMVDGVGYGTLIVSGVATTTKVLVVNNGSGTTYNAFPLIVNDVILSSGTVNIPVGAGPDSVTCYTVG